MLELTDIQGLLLHGRSYGFARYFFLSITDRLAARHWLAWVAGQITTAEPWAEMPPSTLYLGFTQDGLRALGLPEATLATFPEDFRQGMVARGQLLGDTGASSAEHWDGGLQTPALHAMLTLFARDDQELEVRSLELRGAIRELGGLTELSTQDATRLPGRREQFGYREGISDVIVEGSGRESLPGWGPPSKAGEFIIGYPDEYGTIPPVPQPALLGRNSCYLVYRRLYQDVAGFRRFLHQQAPDEDEVEWLAAKLMGRWRSGAPLVLAPEHDDPDLADDPRRSSDFDYGRMDPQGLACPLGAHVRRANPRDSVHGTNRNRLIRRGLPYGPPLPDGAPDDGNDRGVAVIFGCGSISRQFEFVQRVWLNDRKFNGLENDKDPICSDNDGTTTMTIQRKPLRRRIHGIPRFVTVKGGGYFFAPGIAALRQLAMSDGSGLYSDR